MLNCTSYSAFIVQIEVILLCKLRLFRCASWGFLFPHHSWLSLLDNSRKTSPRVCHVEEFIYLSVTKKGASQTYDTPSSLYKSLSISKVIHVYIYYVLFYSYLLKLTEWLMLAISGIEFTTCFKNMPMQRTIPENITAAKVIVKIVIIIINLFRIYYLLFLKYECKVNTFLSNNGIFCREISLQYVFLDMGQPLVFSLENDILLSDMLFLWQ